MRAFPCSLSEHRSAVLRLTIAAPSVSKAECADASAGLQLPTEKQQDFFYESKIISSNVLSVNSFM